LAAGRRIAERLEAAAVVTAGGRGCAVVLDGTTTEIDAHAVEVLDTVGAGDAFCGALGAWLSAGSGLVEAATYANAAGALAVTQLGAEPAMPAAQQIRQLVETTGAVRSTRPVVAALTEDERDRFAGDEYLVGGSDTLELVVDPAGTCRGEQ
jgi:bifunctional ADP-heptose synthase (sugar kinase/adenylyltransferase)